MFSRFLIVLAMIVALIGCDPGRGGVATYNGRATMHMPFKAGTKWLCTQGTEGSYSHSGNSTKYDLDFDTPNPPNAAAMLYAPVAGTAYVHNDTTGFGKHMNIDMGDGTYVVIAHMKQVYNYDGQSVQVGQPIGFAGCTGACSGDHVHIGLHEGDASLKAGQGESIPSNMFNRDTRDPYGPVIPRLGANHVCGVTGGHKYESQLPGFMVGPTLPDEDDDGLVEFCWKSQGLSYARNGELWVDRNGWQTIDSYAGYFSELCGDIQGYSGDTIIVNGQYNASNAPGSPWWICAYTSDTNSQVYGTFWFDGSQVSHTVQDWGGGCNARLTIP